MAVGLVPCALCLLLTACAARRVALPGDAGAPFPGFRVAYAAVTAACSGVRTLTAELALSGRAGGRSVRGRAIAGFARPDSMRLEGVAPFGPPAFILAARGGTATLLLPRDNRVLSPAAPEQILGALTGVALTPADVQAVLTGCVVPAQGATGGRLHENGWVSIEAADGATLYLERGQSGWRLRAARRPGWELEYGGARARFPQVVRLRSVLSSADVDLTVAVSQLETNMALAAEAFAVDVPPGALALSMDELRRAGPLRE